MTYDTILLDVIDHPHPQGFAVGRWRTVPDVAWLPTLSRGGLATVIALAGMFLATSFYHLNHTDLWGHLSFGRWIVEHHELPTSDPWRDFAAADQFANIPWLGQVLGYLWYQAAGAEGLALAHVVLITLAFGLLIAAVRGQGVSIGWAVIGGVAGYLLALPIVGTIRPQLFGGLAFALTLVGLAQISKSRHPLLWLPIVFALWANLHGSVVIGLVAIACVSAGVLWETRVARGSLHAALTDPAVCRLELLLVLALAATCLNPLGARLLLDTGRFAGNLNLEAITEWRPLVLGSMSGALFYTSLGITAVLLRLSPRKVRLHEVLLLVAFGLTTLSAMRMLYWWAFVWPWVVAPHAQAAWDAWRSRVATNATSDAEASTTRTLIAVLVAFLAIVWAPPTHNLLIGQPRPEGVLADRETPLYLGEEMAGRRLEGRIFAPMDWADYLVWTTHGTIQPLVHSHVHLVSPAAWDDYQTLAAGGAGWLQVVDHYGLRYLVLRRGSMRDLSKLVGASPRCRVLYQDQQAVLIEVLPETKKIAAGDALQKMNIAVVTK